MYVEYLGGKSFYMMSFRPGISVRPTIGEIYLVDTMFLKKAKHTFGIFIDLSMCFLSDTNLYSAEI